MQKAGVCGHFGKGENLLNGQTIKTIIFTDELVSQLGEKEVRKLDTFDWRSNPVKMLMQCFGLLRNCENIIILPANNGVKVFVPLFVAANILFRRKLHYVVIGGWLPEMLAQKPGLKNQLKKFSGLYVETHNMVKALNELELNNVHYMPNFKQLNVLKESELMSSVQEPYKLCTFSRVLKEKGIEDAIDAIKMVNDTLNRVAFTLDIYGQIDEDYKTSFSYIIKNIPEYISYKGLVPFDKSTEVLKNYFALLFPTYYSDEGFPGTIIDAFSSALPVIGTDWRYNSEFIQHGVNGYLYDVGADNLKNVLEQIIAEPSKVIEMKINCLQEVKKYEPKTVVKGFIKLMES